MAAYVAVKLPAVFFCAMLAVSVFCWVASLALNADMRYRDVWAAVLLVVALQMVTVMRPMLSRPEEGRLPAGKCFFLKHFAKLCLEKN